MFIKYTLPPRLIRGSSGKIKTNLKISSVGKDAILRLASKFHGDLSRTADGDVDLSAEIKKHPGSLWVRVKAIEADHENDNGDYFSRDEILKSYKTFEGVPVFTNHENNKIESAKGKVVLAEWDEDDQAVYCTMYIDREAYPQLCRAIEEGYATDVSMGTQVEYSTCSICGTKAFTADDYCNCVKTMKGRTVNGKKVFERNYGLKFIEISIVTDGACKDCTIKEVLDPDEFLAQASELHAVAASAGMTRDGEPRRMKDGERKRASEALRGLRSALGGKDSTAAMNKDGGQAEIQKLNQAMDMLEDVTRTMLGQRKFVDLEFMKDLAGVLADLQHTTDELVDQGYGTVGQQPAGTETDIPPLPVANDFGKEEPSMGPKPVTTGPSETGVGKITGPTGASSDGPGMTHLSAHAKDLRGTVGKIQKENSLGDDPVSKEEKFQQTIRKLASVWENPSVKNFKTEVSEGEFKIVVGSDEIIGLRNGRKVASLEVARLDDDVRDALSKDTYKVAGILLDGLKGKISKFAENAPSNTSEQQQMTEEAQLDSQRVPIHPREKETRHSITERQMSSEWHGYDWHKQGLEGKPREEITEKQLRDGGYKGYGKFDRQNAPRDQITERQLGNTAWEGNVTPSQDDRNWAAGVNEQQQAITENQMEQQWRKSDDVHSPDNIITEKQLVDDLGEPWARRIASKDDARKALSAGTMALVRTAKATGATPDELVMAMTELTSPRNVSSASAAVDEMGRNKEFKEAREAMLARSSFYGVTKVASKLHVQNYLLGSLADEGLGGDVGMEILAHVINRVDSRKYIGAAIEKGMGEEPKPAATASDLLREAMAEDDDGREPLTIILEDKRRIVADPDDAEKFAAAAYEAAAKVAASRGLEIIENVHVASKDDGVEVQMIARRTTKEASGATCSGCGKDDCGCGCGGDESKCKCNGGKDHKVACACGKDDCGCGCGGDESKCKCDKKAASDLKARKEARRKLVEGQFGGGTGGGMPAPGFEAGGPPSGGGGTTLPEPAMADPTMAPPASALGEQEMGEGEGEDEGDNGEALPPGSICPACGSSDVDVKSGEFQCNNCGAEGHITVKLDVNLWPGTIKEKGPGEGGNEGEGEGEEGGLGEMEGGEGMEMPEPGIAASFKVTPEMVKVAGNKPIGSYCPHCGSSKVRINSSKGSARGACHACGGDYRVDTYVDPSDMTELYARIEWRDRNVRKLAEKIKNKLKGRLAPAEAELTSALKGKGLEAKFARADLAGKAEIIAMLADQNILSKG